ncbi:aminopeptidase [Candidatus Woesearchaeota archaeon]|nr:aminopeptidase [Candidatus Woesearchaeota archaeon]
MIDWQRFREQIDLNIFKSIFSESLAVGQEKVLIIGDYGVRNRVLSPILTNAYALAARELDLNYNVLMQNAKTRGDFADEVMINSLKRLPKRSIIVMNVSNRIGMLGSLGLSFRRFCRNNEHKFVTSSSLGSLANDSLRDVLNVLNVDYKRMNSKGEKIKRLLDSAREINVRTKIGTDITFDVTGSKSVVNAGNYAATGAGGNMPAGEVYIYPKLDKVEGTFYIDGSMRLKNKTHLVRSPVRIDVEGGEIVNVSSNYEGNLFKQTLEWAHRRAKRPQTIRKIAELGIGINPNAKIIGATIIDEKTIGTVHIANGSNSWFGGEIKSLVHLDHVIRNAIVKVDGRLLRV